MKYLLLINSNDLIRVSPDKVAYITSDGNYSTMILINKEEHLFTFNLGSLERLIEEQLDDDAGVFIRLGKSLIINSEYIYYINVSKQQLVLSDNLFMNQFILSASKEALKTMKNILEERLKERKLRE